MRKDREKWGEQWERGTERGQEADGVCVRQVSEQAGRGAGGRLTVTSLLLQEERGSEGRGKESRRNRGGTGNGGQGGCMFTDIPSTPRT